MDEKPSFHELANRIQADIAYFDGTLPEAFAIAWAGYLAALIEWGLISVDDHDRLTQRLPFIENNPVIRILLGRPDETE